MVAVELEILGRRAQLQFPPAPAVRRGAGLGDTGLDLELRPPVFELLSERVAGAVAHEAEAVEEQLEGVLLLHRRDVFAQGPPAELHPVVEHIREAVGAAVGDARLGAGSQVGAGREVEVSGVPAEEEGGRTRDERVLRERADAGNADRFFPFVRVDRTVDDGRLAQARNLEFRHLLRWQAVIARGPGSAGGSRDEQDCECVGLQACHCSGLLW